MKTKIDLYPLFCNHANGLNNVKTQHQLSILAFGIDNSSTCRLIRKEIENMRFQGMLICSSPRKGEFGYWLLNDNATEIEKKKYQEYLTRELGSLKERFARRRKEIEAFQEKFGKNIQFEFNEFQPSIFVERGKV